MATDRASGASGEGGLVETQGPVSLPLLAARSVVGGLLMGLANLVPGISGGTMLLAAGVYPRFIDAIGELTLLKVRRVSLVTLVSVVAAAAVVVATLAGPVKDLVVGHRWVMYSLFIGLTLGGVPVVARLIGRPSGRVWAGAVFGVAVMAFLAFGGGAGAAAGGDRSGVVVLFLAGLAGASAMILPGVSGGYLLLVLGAYVPILSAISRFVGALGGRDLATAFGVGLTVLLPVGLGVVAGIVGVSNLLRILLARFKQPTLGVLLGLLVGAVLGLWPFQQGVAPRPGEVLKGQRVVADAAGALHLEASGRPVRPEDYPTRFFRPSALQVAEALGLIVIGFGVTAAVDRLGREKRAGLGEDADAGAA